MRLVKQLDQPLATDAFCSSFVFPRSDFVADCFQKAVLKVEQDTLNLEALADLVRTSMELTAIRGREDLWTAVEAMKLVKDELNLGLMDGIVVYRGGLNVLAVKLSGNDCGRVACMEINDYHRRLQSLVTMRSRDVKGQFMATAALSLAICAGIVLGSVIKRAL